MPKAKFWKTNSVAAIEQGAELRYRVAYRSTYGGIIHGTMYRGGNNSWYFKCSHAPLNADGPIWLETRDANDAKRMLNELLERTVFPPKENT